MSILLLLRNYRNFWLIRFLPRKKIYFQQFYNALPFLTLKFINTNIFKMVLKYLMLKNAYKNGLPFLALTFFNINIFLTLIF